MKKQYKDIIFRIFNYSNIKNFFKLIFAQLNWITVRSSMRDIITMKSRINIIFIIPSSLRTNVSI